MKLPFGLRSNFRRRLLFVGIGAAAFLAAFTVGVEAEMTPEEAEQLREDFGEQIEGIDQNGIFVNNIRISLAMFVPGVGVGIGGFSGYTTGAVISSLTESEPLPDNIPPQLIFALPPFFGTLELFVYGLAMSRSGLLVYYFVKKRSWREYVAPTLVELGIAAVVLFAAAIIEWQVIQVLGGLNLGAA